jgi:hypothetical protein
MGKVFVQRNEAEDNRYSLDGTAAEPVSRSVGTGAARSAGPS